MERVVTINLNGNPYQLDESAYDALRAYMGRAEASLADNPDRAEIVRDLEQAIADKAGAYLGAHKSVLSGAEMTAILNEMGPVEGEPREAPNDSGKSGDARKRLYRVREGAWIAGICSGLAAYLDIDVAIVRVLAVVLGFVTSGWLLLAYLIAMFIIPSAQTSAEWAAAHGLPFNTQEIIDRAKREYRAAAEDMSRDWRRTWRAQRRAWRHEWRDWGTAAAAPAANPAGYGTRIFAGLAGFCLSVVSAALLIAFLVALYLLLSTGAFFEWAPPADMPLWLIVVVLCIVYGAVATPLRYLRGASYATAAGHRYDGRHSGDLVALLAILAGGAVAYQLFPEFRAWLEGLSGALSAVGMSLESL